MDDRFHQPIFVTGLPRSGTSMVAGSLKLCGAWTGETVAGGPANPKGFFENQALREMVVKGMLNSLGCDPLGVRPLPPADFFREATNLESGVQALLQQQGYTSDQPWLFKDAKLALLWRVFAHSFPQARWVIVSRQPEDVIASCLRTPFMKQHSEDPAFWQEFVQQYQSRLQALRTSGLSVEEISVEPVIRGDFVQLQALAGRLGLQWQGEAVKAFVEPDHWHGKA